MKENLLTTREVSQILEISEKDVIELTKLGKIPHFKVAGEFLRFQKENILNLKKDIQVKFNISKEVIPMREKVGSFLYFNDFYILSTVIIVALLWVIFKG